MPAPATTQTTPRTPSRPDVHGGPAAGPRHEPAAGPVPAAGPARRTPPRPAPWAAVPGAAAPAAPGAGEAVTEPLPVVAAGLAAVLRCPLTGGRLVPVDADRLMSDRPFRDGVHPVYPVVAGIPCLAPAS